MGRFFHGKGYEGRYHTLEQDPKGIVFAGPSGLSADALWLGKEMQTKLADESPSIPTVKETVEWGGYARI